MSDHALELSGVSKKFRKGEIFDSLRDLIPALTGKYFRSSESLAEEREFWAVRDVSFRIDPGEAVAIVGANGAGKSTILKLLSGVMKPTWGTVDIQGRLSALIEVGAGFHPDLTGRENVRLNGAILGMGRNEIRDKFDQIVDFAGLAEFIDTPVKRYSSGMYARLGFAVASHVDPEILLVDEVLSVGDVFFQNKCIARMNEVRASGATVIFVSHNLKAVSDLCPRSILLEKGQVVIDGATGDVLRAYLDQSQMDRSNVDRQDAHFSSVSLRNESGERNQFRSGEKVWLDIEFEANESIAGVAIGLEIRDDSYYRIFNTSSERLGHPVWSLEPGQKVRVSFELELHLAYGSFHVGLHLFRSADDHLFDLWMPCATFFVTPDRDVRGAVNLRPRVIEPGDRAPEGP